MAFVMGKPFWEMDLKMPWEKSLEQHLTETSLLMQVTAPAIVGSMGWYSLPKSAGIATGAAAAAKTTAAAGSTVAAGSMTAAAAAGAGLTAAKIGGGLMILEWLKENWWIPAALGGIYIAAKVVK